MARKSHLPSLEDLFDLPDDYLKGPQSRSLRPALIEGTERESRQDRLLKYWPKTGTEADNELREIWRHERLQVDRIMSYPGAEDLFAGVVAMIETSDTFCIVHEPGPMPLAGKLRTAPRRSWMRALDIPANRIVLWRNLARLSRALSILHSRGLLHGRIDEYAVFTEGTSDPDFRLGGFEWSLVLGERAAAPQTLQAARGRLESLTYSYAHDWKALGCLIASLVGVDPVKVREEDPYTAGTTVELIEGEIDFLRMMIDPDREEVVESATVVKAVAALGRELSGHGNSRTGKFLIVFRPNQKMSETIYDLSEQTINSADVPSQRLFVESDLATGARIAAASGDDDPDHLFVLTDTSSYRVQRFTELGAETWQVGVITAIKARNEDFALRECDVFPVRHGIEVLPNKEAVVKTLSKASDDILEWTLPLVKEATTEEDPETRILRNAFLLVQSVEAILRALEILPIEIVGTRRESGKIIIQLMPRSTERDEIAASIGDRPTADVMEKLFDKDDQGVDVDWRISTSGGLGGTGSGDVPARFETAIKGDAGERIYEFSAFDLPRREDSLFLRKKGDHGTESLIKRRLRTSRVIGEQRDLVTMFVDPRRNLKPSSDLLEKDSHFTELDPAKREALEALWSTSPTHLVVGPPGVGKTKLVSEIIRRKLANEPAASILVSSQSHQALDHVLRATDRVLNKYGTDAIVVRSPGPEGSISTDADIRLRAIEYLEKASASTLAANSPVGLQSGLRELLDAFKQAARPDAVNTEQRENEGMRAHTALVLDSANLVFSTSTSADVERLVDEGSQFDWAIIEEAAKAAGPDLLAPLSLSGRRLFIGDHKQLPPFDSERINAILADGSVVRSLLKGADRIIGSAFYDTGLEELTAVAADDSQLDRVRSMAIRVFEPFRALVLEDESRRAIVGGARKAASSELLVQHRMDPDIARLVSACFYNDRLTTSDKRIADAAKPLPFSFGSDFPSSPIVIVDMPHVSRTGKAQPVESDRPRWNNRAEARVIGAMLRNLRLSSEQDGMKPSLAVLTPYRAQVRHLTHEIDVVKAKGDGLSGFDSFNSDDRFWGTVDSSQGSEADLVIVSLVRNNPRTGVPALGFLRDPRRMNVLLSRARQQLVIVGSLEFLKEATRHATADPKDELSFVVRFLKTLDQLTKARSARGEPAARIVKPTQIKGAGR
jgi:hypothetical protein